MSQDTHNFAKQNIADWEKAAAKSAPGGDLNKLNWVTPDGITVKPYYRAEDIAGLPYLDSAPGVFPYLRGTGVGQWRIRETIEAVDPKAANQAAHEALAAGAEEIAFAGVAVKSEADLGALLKGLDVPVHFAGKLPPLDLVLKVCPLLKG